MQFSIVKSSETILTAFNLFGVFAFAISGAAAGMRKRADLFGIAVLAFAASCCGGILRDLLIGALPPENILSIQPIITSLVAAAVTVLFYPRLAVRFTNPVLVFDAFGLGVFTVAGAEKALLYGIGPLWAVLLGMLTAIGGGVVRDILLSQVPQVLRTELYATASIAGGAIAVAGQIWPIIPTSYTMTLGAVVCILLRWLAIKYSWKVPVLRVVRS